MRTTVPAGKDVAYSAQLKAFLRVERNETPGVLCVTKLPQPQVNEVLPVGQSQRHQPGNWLGEQRSYKTATEWIVRGTNHPVDAAWQTGKETHVFEVVVGCEDNLISHLSACFITSDAVDRATIVAPQKSKLAELKAVIDGESTLKPFVDRIAYLPAETILKELWPS